MKEKVRGRGEPRALFVGAVASSRVEARGVKKRRGQGGKRRARWWSAHGAGGGDDGGAEAQEAARGRHAGIF